MKTQPALHPMQRYLLNTFGLKAYIADSGVVPAKKPATLGGIPIDLADPRNVAMSRIRRDDGDRFVCQSLDCAKPRR